MNLQYSKLFRDFYITGGGYLRLYRRRKSHDQLMHTYYVSVNNNTALVWGPEWDRYAPLVVEYVVNNIKLAKTIRLDRRYSW